MQRKCFSKAAVFCGIITKNYHFIAQNLMVFNKLCFNFLYLRSRKQRKADTS